MFSCPEGWYCRFISCTTGVCEEEPAERGGLTVGQACTTDHECNSLRCQRLVDGSYCADDCDYEAGGVCPDSTAGDPPLDTTCQPLERGLCGYCGCSAGMMGDACSTDAHCQEDLGCVHVDGSGVCALDCSTGAVCPGGFACQPPGDGSSNACLPDLSRMGQTCTSDGECAGGVCIEEGSESVCSRKCGFTGCTCPVGYTCSQVAEDVNACVVSSLVMVSGCGCSLPGAHGGPGWPVAIIVLILVGYAVFATRRKI
jgi:hypothetical protein